MITHFQVLVALLVGCMALLSGIFGLIWRIAAAWQRTQDMIQFIQDRLLALVAEKTSDHKDFGDRISALEATRKR